MNFLDELKMDVSLTVYDNIKYDWFHLGRRFEYSQLLVQGLYTRYEAEIIGKSFDIPSRNIFCCNKEITKCLETANLSRDEDKQKAIINWTKENRENKIFPFGVVFESKKEGSTLADSLKTIGIKAGNFDNFNKGGIDVLITNQIQTELLKTKGQKAIFIVNLPRSVEQMLVEKVTDLFCRHHYFISDKEYLKKRNSLVLEYIEPSNIVKFCKILKEKAVRVTNMFKPKIDDNENVLNSNEQNNVFYFF